MGRLTGPETGGGGGGAPSAAEYLTLSLAAGLTAERVLTPGLNITFLDTGPNGTLTIDATASGAPVGAQYVVMALNGALTDERRLQAGTGLTLTDGGAGGDAAFSITPLGITGALIADATITFGKIQDIATDRLLGRDTPGAGSIEEISLNVTLEFTGAGAIQRAALTGDVTAPAGSNATTIANDAVTFAKMQNIGTDRLIGRDTAAAGDPEEIALDTTLEFTGAQVIRRAAITGDVTIAAGSNAATIPANTITNAMLRDSAAFSVIGKFDAGAGDPADIVAADETVLGRTGGGNLTFAQVVTGQIANDAVTFAKFQNITDVRLLGRSAGSPGDMMEITIGSPLTLAAGALDFDETALLGNNARVAVSENSGATIGTRRRLNFIEGTNVTLTIADDAGNEEVDITIAASGGGGGASATTVEVDLGATPVFRGKFTITDAAIGATSKVLCWQAPGPYTGKGTRADEAEMSPVSVIAVEPAAGSAVVKWQTPPIVGAPRQVQLGQRRNAAGATFDRLDNQIFPEIFDPKRIGRVRGNVKFSYAVFA